MVKQYQILKETIVHVIQNSGLDIGAAYFIVKDIFNDVERSYYAQLNQECLEEAQEINEETDETQPQNDTDS